MNQPVVDLIGRWILGGAFITAALPKIVDPAAFAKIIYGYGLVPNGLINMVAITLPFLEFIAGLAVLSGLFLRPADRILILLLLTFIGAVLVNWIRGHSFDCGCFSLTGQAEPSSPAAILLRDLFLMVCALFVLRFQGVRLWALGKTRS